MPGADLQARTGQQRRIPGIGHGRVRCRRSAPTAAEADTEPGTEANTSIASAADVGRRAQLADWNARHCCAAANQIESRPPGRRRRGAGTLPAPGSMDQDFALDSCRGTLPLAGKRRINSRFPNNQHATIGVSARVSLFLAASQLQSHITLARGRTSDSPRLAGPGSLGACSLFRRPARRACVCPDCHLTGNQNGMEE